MPNHETESCPRCGNSFTCKSGSYFLCDCFSVEISHEARVYIQQEGYDDCLCNTCLLELQQEYEKQYS
jgi:hypothetical protein